MVGQARESVLCARAVAVAHGEASDAEERERIPYRPELAKLALVVTLAEAQVALES